MVKFDKIWEPSSFNNKTAGLDLWPVIHAFLIKNKNRQRHLFSYAITAITSHRLSRNRLSSIFRISVKRLDGAQEMKRFILAGPSHSEFNFSVTTAINDSRNAVTRKKYDSQSLFYWLFTLNRWSRFVEQLASLLNLYLIMILSEELKVVRKLLMN